MIISLEILLEELKKMSKKDEPLAQKQIELNILPTDVPPKDSPFPSPPPNKRVIIIDI